VLREAVASGVNHIDTSDYYGPHVTNQLIKQALHPYPEDLVIVTKVGARRVTLWAAPVKDSPAGQQEIEVRVSDNGPGLPKEALRLVFDPFVVRSDSPMEYGIHLMACYFIVHHHGGSIDAHSDKGCGTTFTLRLPVNPARVPPPRDEQDFLHKVLLADSLWEKLISSE
jgi:nitrogen-specific signal transduction histidine kinase